MTVESFPTMSAGDLRKRSMRNLSRMGHCAPTVMQTMLCAQCIAASDQDAIAPESREAYRELYAHWQQREFHCGDAVFAQLDAAGAPDELADAITAFMGGTVFTGMTCGALTAGVMALGLALGEIEDSRPRVARMIATMALGGDAIADDVNKFNHVVNLGHDLARWFEEQFGSTQCRTLTGCDFATAEGVRAYIEHDGTARCTRIAQLVADRVAEMISGATAEIG